MSLELINPNLKVEFMNRRMMFVGISGVLILASVISILVFGLNLGIDFKGGSKVILAFKGDAQIDRTKLGELTAATFAKMMPGNSIPQVQVQDFYAGGTEESGEKRFVIYTELVSLLTEEEKAAIVADLKKQFGEGTVVNPPQEGSDQFYISFKEGALIEARSKELKDLFAAHKFTEVVIEAEKIRDMEMEHVKDLNMLEQEDNSDTKNIDRILADQEFEKQMAEFRAGTMDRNYTVRIEEIKAAVAGAVMATPELASGFIAVESATSVSPSVGKDLLNEGLLAVLYAIIGILLYIALRFDFKFSPGAVVALLHDVIITMGVFSVLQVPFSLPIIAAMLTIVGYSVNDTIVVFDRIRENIAKLRDKPLDRVVNISINETMSRTILTSGTTLLVVISIFVLGGGLIKDFALALMIGIVIGTYSSIFVASPVLLFLDRIMKPKGA